jgi:hypothetical protein
MKAAKGTGDEGHREIELKFVLIDQKLNSSEGAVQALMDLGERLDLLMKVCHQSEFVSHFYCDPDDSTKPTQRVSRVERLKQDGTLIGADFPSRVFGLRNEKTPIGGGRRSHGFSDSVAAIEKETPISPKLHDALIGSSATHVSKLRIRLNVGLYEIEYDIFLSYPPYSINPHLLMTAEVEIQDMLPSDLSDQEASARMIDSIIDELNTIDSGLGRHSLSSYSNKDMAVREGGTNYEDEWLNTYPYTYQQFTQLWGVILFELTFKRDTCCKIVGALNTITDTFNKLNPYHNSSSYDE